MARSTPPRPVDIATVFPELAALARTTVRLHPRPGAPTVHVSSVGGPLLWPAGEPWPVCTASHPEPPIPRLSLAEARAYRRIMLDVGSRTGGITDQERAIVDSLGQGQPWRDQPNALLPVAQLYLRDIPGLAGPQDTDLLQVLWCPLDHVDTYMPAPRVVWRRSTTVTTCLASPPEPAFVDFQDDYVPEPCVVHPEPVTEYPAPYELDRELRERIWAWCENLAAGPGAGIDPDEAAAHYQYDLSVAPGWKVGGWGPWSFSDPQPMHCTTCGAEPIPLFTAASGEWDGGNASWIPLEERDASGVPYDTCDANPVGVTIGRTYHLQIYRCPVSYDHPYPALMQ